MLDFGNYRDNKVEEKTEYEPVANGFYEVTITKASFYEGTNDNGQYYSYIRFSFQIRKDVDQKFKNRYVNGKIRPNTWDKENNCRLPDDKIESLESVLGREVLPYIKEDITKKDTRDWLSVCEFLEGKNVRIKVTNNNKTWVDKKTGVTRTEDPYIDFYLSKVTDDEKSSKVTDDEEDLPF